MTQQEEVAVQAGDPVLQSIEEQPNAMPQLDFSTYPSQFFWLAVTFVALYLVMAFISLPRVRNVLVNRQTRISGDLKKAEALKEEAESAEVSFTSALDEAKNKANEIVTKTRKKIAEEEAARHAKLDQKFVKQNKESEQKLQLLRNESVEKLAPVATMLTVEAAKKLAGIDISQAEAEEIVRKNFKLNINRVLSDAA